MNLRDRDIEIKKMKKFIVLLFLISQAEASLIDSGRSLPPVMAGAVSSADYNNDGWPDLAISGLTLSGYSQTSTTNLFLGSQTGFIEDQALPPLTGSVIAWADYDMDGDLDLAISGYGPSVPITKLFKNNSGLFSEAQSLIGVGAGAISFVDVDNDGDQDLAICGSSTAGPVTKLFKNQYGTFTEAQSLTGVYR